MHAPKIKLRKQEVQDEVDARPEEGGQKNVSRQAFMLCNPCEC